MRRGRWGPAFILTEAVRPCSGRDLSRVGYRCVFGCRVAQAGGALSAGPRLSPHGLPGMQRQSARCVERQAGPVDERHCEPLGRPDDRQRKCSEEPCPAR